MPGIFVDGFVCAHCFLHIFDSFKIMKNVSWSFKKKFKVKILFASDALVSHAFYFGCPGSVRHQTCNSRKRALAVELETVGGEDAY